MKRSLDLHLALANSEALLGEDLQHCQLMGVEKKYFIEIVPFLKNLAEVVKRLVETKALGPTIPQFESAAELQLGPRVVKSPALAPGF